jgi:O-antigen/teichoic acid export membrane protein
VRRSTRRVLSVLGMLRGDTGFAAVAQTGLATVAVLGINVVTGILSARFLGPQGRGELSVLLLCPPLLSFLFTLGLPSAFVVLARKEPRQERALLGTALILSCFGGLTAVGAGLLLLPRLTEHYSSEIASEARMLLVFAFVGATQATLWSALQVRERFGVNNLARCWQTALVLISLGLLAVTHAFHPWSGALGYLLPSLPYFIWTVIWVFREFRPNLAQFHRHARELLAFGIRVHMVDVGNTLFQQLDKLILVGILTPSMLGIYVVVFNLSRLLTTLGNSVIPVLLPKAAGKPVGKMLDITSRSLTVTALLNATGVAAFVLFGKLALELLYGQRFASGYLTLAILSVDAALASGATILQQPYLMLKRPGALAAYQVVSLGIGGVLMYILAQRFGIEGAACGLLLATSLRVTLIYGGFSWSLRVRPPRMIPNRQDWDGLLVRARLRAG